MIVAPADLRGLKPATIYGNGIGRFLTLIIGEQNLRFAITFGAMAFSTFVFDTLDVCTRLGRYILQELLGWRSRVSAAVATLVFMAVPAYILLTTGAGGWAKFWTLFGASNQLLAALTLITLTVWLRRTGRPFLFVFIPMLFVLVITLWALIQLFIVNVRAVSGGSAAIVNACAAAAFIVPGIADSLLDDAIVYSYAGGSTIGHEITHGFDDQGRQFDEKGNLTDWWTPEDAKEFNRRAAGVVKQYGQYIAVKDIHINGSATQGENIADLGGLGYGQDDVVSFGKRLIEDERLATDWVGNSRAKEQAYHHR
jgi:hypothetical protein